MGHRIFNVGDICKNFLLIEQVSYNKKRGCYVYMCECLKCNKRSKKIMGSIRGCKYCELDRRSISCFRGYGEISGTYWRSILRTARRRGIKVLITIEDAWNLFVNQQRRCAITRLILIMSQLEKEKSKRGKRKYSRTASLDRIDSSKDYTLDNIQWVHKCINSMKNAMDTKEFIYWCKLVSDNNG